MKVLRVSFLNGEEYDIPLDYIARHCANSYYSEHDLGWKEQFDFVMEDDYKAEDWASNNMDWTDVESIARKVTDKKNNYYEDEFCNAEKQIMEVWE